MTTISRGETLALPDDCVHIVTRGSLLREVDRRVIDFVATGQGFVGAATIRPVDECDVTTWALAETAHALASAHVLAEGQRRMDRLATLRHIADSAMRLHTLLGMLADEDGCCPPIPWRYVAALIGVRPETCSRIVRLLEDREWIERRDDRVVVRAIGGEHG